MSASSRKQISLIISNLLLPVALLVFASGFFPYKPVLPGLARLEDQRDELAKLPAAPFDRVVFMIVDALRSDFVYGHHSGFTFTQSLINNGAAIPFTAHATPPTVTMPRVKALTTGSVPSFLDLILNFAESDTSSSLASQDTWLAQLRSRAGGKLVFYGDDTWLKLFPDEDFFARYDGTSSFFVSDFTEVDNNVTRHLASELINSDWNGMIMHYLGLDHIGHKTGPEGPNMLPKQKEMDDIVRTIYEAIERETHHSKTLLILAGDHGMNAGGNHGGSGPGETEPALLFISPQFARRQASKPYSCPIDPKPGTDFHFYDKIEQSDVVPTLSALLGLPIPKNSLGVILPDVLHLWPETAQLALLQQNANQMRTIIESNFGKIDFEQDVAAFTSSNEATCNGISSDRQVLACDIVRAQRAAQSDSWTIARQRYYDFLLGAQDIMSGTASSYDLSRMAAGMTLAFICISLASWASPLNIGFSTFFLGLMCVLYGIMMFASSYVEEEQHFWYWLTPIWFGILACRSLARDLAGTELFTWRVWRPAFASLTIIALTRLAIRWNQTGQKHAGEPDIVHTIFPEHHETMWLLILITYMLIGYQIFAASCRDLLPDELAAPTALLLVLTAVIFKLNFTQADAPELVQGLAVRLRSLTEPFSLVAQARALFLLLAGLTVLIVLLTILRSRLNKGRISEPDLTSRIQPLLSLFLATQTRAPNVPLLLVMDLQAKALWSALRQSHDVQAKKDYLKHAISVLLLAYTSFFCFGGSNSISSLDLSNAYNGVADYNILAVGILLFASNWTGPVWWTIASCTLLRDNARETPPLNRAAPSTRAWVQEEHKKLHADAVRAARKHDSSQQSSDSSWQSHVAVWTIFHGTACLAVMAACTVLRTHLFIWTVFSPKYLYMMAWTVGWHLLVNCGLGLALQCLTSVTS